MADAASTYLAPWASYYVMVGSGSAALIGLMFVVITLVGNVEETRRATDGVSTFSTPTVSHFSTTLFISAIAVAPWKQLLHPAIALILTGLYGSAYGLLIIYRMRGSYRSYDPDIDDFVWYGLLPFLAFVVVLASAILLFFSPVTALFGVAAGAVGLLFIGIRNAWDVVTFLALHAPRGPSNE